MINLALSTLPNGGSREERAWCVSRQFSPWQGDDAAGVPRFSGHSSFDKETPQ